MIKVLSEDLGNGKVFMPSTKSIRVIYNMEDYEFDDFTCLYHIVNPDSNNKEGDYVVFVARDIDNEDEAVVYVFPRETDESAELLYYTGFETKEEAIKFGENIVSKLEDAGRMDVKELKSFARTTGGTFSKEDY